MYWLCHNVDTFEIGHSRWCRSAHSATHALEALGHRTEQSFHSLGAGQSQFDRSCVGRSATASYRLTRRPSSPICRREMAIKNRLASGTTRARTMRRYYCNVSDRNRLYFESERSRPAAYTSVQGNWLVVTVCRHRRRAEWICFEWFCVISFSAGISDCNT